MLTRFFLLLTLLTGSFWFSPRAATQPRVDSPRPGEVIQGQVTISGSTAVAGFVRSEIAFGYEDDTTGTWFPFLSSEESVRSGPLGVWDTTTISDGTYRLRVRVWLQDGGIVETVVDNLKVSNYSQLDSTPLPAEAVDDQDGIVTPDVTGTPAPPTPTALPMNPAEVTTQGLASSTVTGIIFVVLILLLFWIYRVMRSMARH